MRKIFWLHVSPMHEEPLASQLPDPAVLKAVLPLLQQQHKALIMSLAAGLPTPPEGWHWRACYLPQMFWRKSGKGKKRKEKYQKSCKISKAKYFASINIQILQPRNIWSLNHNFWVFKTSSSRTSRKNVSKNTNNQSWMETIMGSSTSHDMLKCCMFWRTLQ